MGNIHSPEFRVAWPKVFKPEADEKGKMWYSVQALFPPGEKCEELKAAAHEALIKKFGSDQSKWPTNLISPFKKQTKTRVNREGKVVENVGHTEGAILMSFKTAQKPGVVDSAVQPILNDAEFYAGCWAIASLQVSAYDNKSKGVTFYLQNIMKKRDDTPLAGRATPESEFAPIAGTETGAKSTNDLFG